MSAYSMIPGGRLGVILLLGGLLAGCGGDDGAAAGDEVALLPAGSPAVGAVQPDGSLGPDSLEAGEEPDEGAAAEVPGSGIGMESPDGSSRATGSPTTPPSRTPTPPRPGTGSATGAGDAPAQGPQAPSTAELLRATSRAYEGLRSFRAGFEQTLHNTLLGRTTRSEGTLYQRQPDRFLMAFAEPSDDVIVSDGEFFWMYFPSVDRKQVIRTPRGSQGLDLHAQFIGDPVRRFEATYHGTEAVRGRAAHVVTLVPRERMGYSRLKVWIDDADHLVRRFELTEGNENVREFVLRDMVKNPTLPDSLFAFTPPPGSQVVDR